MDALPAASLPSVMALEMTMEGAEVWRGSWTPTALGTMGKIRQRTLPATNVTDRPSPCTHTMDVSPSLQVALGHWKVLLMTWIWWGATAMFLGQQAPSVGTPELCTYVASLFYLGSSTLCSCSNPHGCAVCSRCSASQSPRIALLEGEGGGVLREVCVGRLGPFVHAYPRHGLACCPHSPST